MKASDIISGNRFFPHRETPTDRFCILQKMRSAMSANRHAPA
jgi:hypothetical protein